MLSNIVIFIGAGFSAPAQFPIQNRIIKEMIKPIGKDFLSASTDFENEKFYISYIEVALFLLDNYTNISIKEYLNRYTELLEQSKTLLIEKAFISTLYKNATIRKEIEATKILKMVFEEKNQIADIYIQTQQIAQLARLKETLRRELSNYSIDIDLEELFTKLDICVRSQVNWKDYSYTKLDHIRQSLLLLFIYYFGIKDASFVIDGNYQSFAQYLSNNRVSIITTNWDTICEQIVLNSNKEIDLCLGYNDIRKRNKRDTIRVAKVHGSINWFTCLNCGRVNVKERTQEASFLLQKQGEFCSRCNCKQEGTYQFVPEIITPTMIKTFSHNVYSNIWQNAEVILQSATKIIFVGYSMPLADFELRQLLTKYLPVGAEIHVVLHNNDRKTTDKEAPEDRYKRTFPKNKMQFYYDGFTAYFDT